MTFIRSIPDPMIDFILVTVFSLLIGLSQRKLHVMEHDTGRTFGTDRTFTFIGILGYILCLLDTGHLYLFLGGGLALIIFFAISYYFHIRNFNDFGITTILIGLITYCLGPLILTQPRWLVILLVVAVLIFTELKERFISLSEKFDRDEFITLAKFLVIAGVILPVIPDEPFLPNISLTPYKIWLAVVVISSISYFSYLLQKFVFKKGSIIISGILGGLYSSTATTIILAKKSREDTQHLKQYIAGIIFATAMMYLRILLIIAVFNTELLLLIWPWFLILTVVSAIVASFFFWFRNTEQSGIAGSIATGKNPLEFKVALIFTVLYVAFTFITYGVVSRFGNTGLNVLSLIVGLTDIDPFLINLFQGKYGVGTEAMALATLQAIISNNVLKMAYSCFFSSKKTWKFLISGFIIIIALNIVFALIV
jgi:uncharacterized membrane protein (DUF4010 family)